MARQLAKLSCQEDRIAGKMKITETDAGEKKLLSIPLCPAG